MATKWFFTVDGNYYPLPSGWDTVSLTRSYDGRILRTQLSGTLKFTEDLYKVLLALLDADPCASVDIEFKYTCPPIGKELLLKSGRLRLLESVHDCTKCILSIPIRDFSRLETIDPSTEVCVDGTYDMALFQVESGTEYTDYTGLFPLTTKAIPVITLLKQISDFFDDGAGIINSDFFGAGGGGSIMSHHVYRVEMPTFLNGDRVTIAIVNEFGSLVQGNVDVISYTATQLAQRLKNTLLYIPFIRFGIPGRLEKEEITHRVSHINLLGSDLVIYTDYEIADIQIKVNGINQAGLITEIQPYNYGMKNLVVTAKALSATDQICTSWKVLNDALYSLFNTVVDDQGENIRVDTFDNVFPIGAASTTASIGNRRMTERFDDTWVKQRAQFGNTFKISGLEASQEGWTWELFSYIFPSKQPNTPQPLPQSGVVSFQGQICITNIGPGNQLGVGMDLFINGVPIGSGLGLGDFFAGTTALIDFPSLIAEGALQNEFCITAGDVVEWRFVGGGIPAGLQLCAQQPKNQYRVKYELPCIDSPTVKESSADQGYNTLMEFADCSGVIDKRMSGQYYSGLGYAISQQAQGLSSYDNNFFIESDDGYTAKQYQREFYFAENEGVCSSCFEDNTWIMYYYNMLLQKPHIIRNFKSAVPSDIQLDVYLIVNTLDQANQYSAQISITPTGTQFADHNRFRTYEGEVRQTPDEFLAREDENVALFSGCGLTGVEGKIVSMDFNLRTGRGSIKLLR